jgi:mRNA interferase MazF
MEMRRGDLVTVAMAGAYGKPRPALIIQADRYRALQSVTFLPLTSDALEDQIFRITIAPTADNGLRATSQVMVDKCSTLPVQKVGAVFGQLEAADLSRVERALAAFLGFA